MAFAVNASRMAEVAPMSNWQARSRRTARPSMFHAMRRVCRSTEGGRAHSCVKLVSLSGFFAWFPSKTVSAGGGGGTGPAWVLSAGVAVI